MENENKVLQKVRAFEERYLMKFQIPFSMCKSLGIQRKRLQKILDKEIEPTLYECAVFDKFLKLPNN